MHPLKAPFMKTKFKYLLYCMSLVGLLTVACKKDDHALKSVQEYRGDPVTITLTHSYSVTDIDSVLRSYNPLIPVLIHIQYALDVYKVIYRSLDAAGNMTIASGLLAVPRDVTKHFPLCTYEHGTSFERYGVPSYESNEFMIAIAFGSEGYVMVLPDYIGLGDSPGFHPYIHAKTEATATIDFLRATRRIGIARGFQMNNQLFVCGYSQGGHAAIAAYKEIQENYSSEFHVTAACGMSGPYDCSGAQKDMLLSDGNYPSPFYLPYLLNSYVNVYHMYPDLASTMRPPYNTTITPYIDGYHGSSIVDSLMPLPIKNVLDSALLADFLVNQNSPFRLALRDNDLMEWKPMSPTRLTYCKSDSNVTYLNAINAFNRFVALGAPNVEVFDADSTADHGGCVYPALIGCKNFFDQFKILQ